MSKKSLPASAAFAIAFLFCGHACFGKAGKKFIELGWDIPNTDFLRSNYRQMEEKAPFDGVIFKVEVKDSSGKTVRSEAGWDGRRWEREWFAGALADLQACRFRKFTDNFVRFNATPGDLQWGDDAGWAALCEKAAILAWLVRQGDCRGLSVDFESYGARQFQFTAGKGYSFLQTAKLARRRGREFIGAIASEYPDARILALWLNSINIKAGLSGDADVILATETYGLLPSFINGMLDGIPSSMVLIDGCEHGYYMDGRQEYLNAAGRMRQWGGPAARLVAPENRVKYRSQVQAGFGFYLDMYVNEVGNRYYFGPGENGTRLDRLRDNLAAALAAADEYVWIYGEQCRWWPMAMSDWKQQRVKESPGAGRLWEEALPGLTEVIEWIRNPVAAAQARIAVQKREGKLVNLVKNHDFSNKAKSGMLPEGFTVWQSDDNPKGTFSWDGSVGGGSAKAVKGSNGVFMQKHEVEAGQDYAVEARCLAMGGSICTLFVRWQSGDGQWARWEEDKTFVYEKNGEQWGRAFGVVTVPRGAGRLVILLAVKGQVGEDDVCWFDDVGLYRLK
ncbi:MAG: hypothetical protein JW720_07865 [Sedimentisphaerales bacterium]|nr:hypothetical protein [Sedimentisphaerales bacterium]